MKPWKNRIVGHGTEQVDQLLANPSNYRLHDAAQQAAMVAVLDQVGIVQTVIVNQQTGHMVDGHMRVVLAMRREEEALPVTYVDLSPDEERLVLATFDPLGALAGADRDGLADLLSALDEEAKAVAALVQLPDMPRQREREVSFTSTEKFRVLVECRDEADRLALMERLAQDGYACKAK